MTSHPLTVSPSTLTRYKEIGVQYDESLAPSFNSLSPAERVFVYFLFRASVVGNRIAADQQHRFSLELLDFFQTIRKRSTELVGLVATKASSVMAGTDMFNMDLFVKDVETYCVYLWTNHGMYFQREHSNEKRTPVSLHLNSLTRTNLLTASHLLGISHAETLLDRVGAVLFDVSCEPTATVQDSIEKSGVNFYSRAFTDADFSSLSESQRHKINAYFDISESKSGGDTEGPSTRSIEMTQYSCDAKYGKELQVSVHWLKRAWQHAMKHGIYFDEHLVKSLEHLIAFLETGEEERFREHSVEWLQSSSRVDYNFGFVETYDDPKGYRGSFQAEATIKLFDMKALSSLLRSIEEKLPVPPEFRRESIDTMPNASVNRKIFGMGGLGPLNITAAYNLPNYEDLRSKYGSKQIIYPSDPKLSSRLNPSLARRLFHCKKMAQWLEEHDPEDQLDNDLWDIQCILHETVGHGSGRLATHTFVEGDSLSVGGKSYKVGDTIPVTHEVLVELLKGHLHTMEEMRAEIISLYVTVFHLDSLLKCNLLSRWASVLTEQELVERAILHMARVALNRLMAQSEDAKEMAGVHSRANTTITNFLISKGGIEYVEEMLALSEEDIEGMPPGKEFGERREKEKDKEITRDIEEEKKEKETRGVEEKKWKTRQVVDIAIRDFKCAKQAILELFLLVQKIVSTGDGIEATRLIDSLGRPLNARHMHILKENRQLIVGDLKVTANLSPHFVPVYVEGECVDVEAEWPADIFEQMRYYESLEYSTSDALVKRNLGSLL